MDTDDLQRGTLLSRRDALKLLGVTSAALLAGCIPGLSGASQATSPTVHPISPTSLGAPPACVVRPELTEGPYFVDEQLNRSDIRSDPGTGAVSLGTPLRPHVPRFPGRRWSLRPSPRRQGGCLALRRGWRLL